MHSSSGYVVEAHRMKLTRSLVVRGWAGSLNVLEDASLGHFQQLLRTKLKVESAKMATVRQPFEIPPASVRVGRAAAPHWTGADQYFQDGKEEPAMQLSFTVRSSVKCVVQVLWGVRTEALQQLQYAQPSAPTTPISSPRSPGRSQDRLPVLHRLPTPHKSFGQRAVELPSLLSRVRRQTRRHRLEDDNERDDERCRAAPDASCSLEHLLGEENFLSASRPQRSVSLCCYSLPSLPPSLCFPFSVAARFEASGEHALLVEIPHNSASSSTEEVRSLLAEVAESDMPTTRAPTTGTSEPDMRYCALVLVGTLACVEAEAPHCCDAGVLWQCVAVDLSPKTAVAAAPSVVVTRQFTATRTRVLEQEEVFGRGDSECVICLERAQAAVLLPCRHLCVCRPCLREIDRCPICRAAFSSYACFAESDGSKAKPEGDCIEVKIV
ncbi:hypothetical protein PybrP1_003967 [[Pythium] brassicae (nom. inval.)]|nr:hypothetical protein PybrP1_003967 [[Pythium] brassicae (nom. inval.)]